MRIAVLGAGAMGSLFGGYLSRCNDVWLVDVNADLVDAINAQGVRILEKGEEINLRPRAVCASSDIDAMDLVIVFVKSLFSEGALKSNANLIGKNTYVMTLQNGAGHEAILEKYIDRGRIIIGTTMHNSSIVEPGRVNHGGGGKTTIGLLDGGSSSLQRIADNFSRCGIETETSDNVKKSIWNKLFVNASASIVTAVLQTNLDYIAVNKSAWELTERLAREAVGVANADGMGFDVDIVLGDISKLVSNARNGFTSIYADIRDGRKTEVDTISGFVVREAKRLGVEAPGQELIACLCHALEGRSR